MEAFDDFLRMVNEQRLGIEPTHIHIDFERLHFQDESLDELGRLRDRIEFELQRMARLLRIVEKLIKVRNSKYKPRTPEALRKSPRLNQLIKFLREKKKAYTIKELQQKLNLGAYAFKLIRGAVKLGLAERLSDGKIIEKREEV